MLTIVKDQRERQVQLEQQVHKELREQLEQQVQPAQ